jgi:hypothetical protein
MFRRRILTELLLQFSTVLSLFRRCVNWGNLEGIHLPGLFERKGKCICVPFLDPEDIKNLSLGTIGTVIKGQGSPELISDYGAKRASL